MLDRVLFILLLVWNLVSTSFIFLLVFYYRRLTKGVKQGNLKRILKSLLKQGKLSEENFKELEKRIVCLEGEEKLSLKKIGLAKFNPFSELGGDQSFSLALLNRKDSGIVVTSLHGRQTTRIYAKLVDGKKEKVKFSAEESEAIKKAL
ncbi:MAG: DUF4446 family protein [Patescibacteria group bacterium]|nr:DUF4446 family protein [Patescibacteria group bacterium]